MVELEDSMQCKTLSYWAVCLEDYLEKDHIFCCARTFSEETRNRQYHRRQHRNIEVQGGSYC